MQEAMDVLTVKGSRRLHEQQVRIPRIVIGRTSTFIGKLWQRTQRQMLALIAKQNTKTDLVRH